MTQLPLKAQKRITSDLSELAKNESELNENGIYWYIDEDNIREIFVVIRGQDDTPYANVPFLFKFVYPDNYPLSPPNGTFCTSDGQTRFNPNLYVGGKICLSILGTWSGPSWTPVMTTKTIIMSIIALVMTNEPLRNEPGWENAIKNEIDEYNTVVEFASLRYGILEQLSNCQLCFQPLLEKMIDRFKKDYPKIMDRIGKNIEKYRGVDFVRPRYGSHAKIDYIKLRDDMREFGRKHGLEVVIEEPVLIAETQINPKLSPAANYEVGLEVNWEGFNYVVKINKSGKKYWRKN